MVVHLGVQRRSAKARFSSSTGHPAERRLRIAAGKEPVQQSVKDNRGFAACHAWLPPFPSSWPVHGKTDSPRITLSLTFSAWACFSADYGGVKLHLLYDPGAAVPTYFPITPNRINDITPAKAMPLEPGTTYVMDRGYYHFGFWAKLDEAGCRFVTRLKSPRGAIPMRSRCARSSSSARRAASCASSPTASTGRQRPLSTSTRHAGRSSCSSNGSSRNLKIKSFLGTSLNAVTPQIITALIAYLLLH